ncbi:MAG: DUF1566 domain-containing protein [Treponema sp.]|nr:DUF1566 domain-containing protein [Treponema sp.]
MKNVKKILGIIAMIAIIGIGFIVCDDGGNTGGNQTPVVSDYNIDNLVQAPGVVIAVTITAKNGSSPGAISNIRYAGNAMVPQTAGIYAVYFDVAAATGWNAAADLFAGNLMIGILPVASDYNIGNLYQQTGNVTAVTITPKSGVSPGSVTNIRYGGSTAIPQTEGTYAVTFDVEAATGWFAVTNLSAGNLIVYDFSIGSTGPGGGIVFYDKGSVSDGWRYLEAAPVNQGSLAWASSGYTSTNIPGTGTAIGTGKANTAAILAVDVNAPAARACVNYSGGGLNDWFLPSIDELNEMYKSRTHLGISEGLFWSSSQRDYLDAWGQYFGDGDQYYYHKNYYNYVRAVRAF